MSCQCTCTCTIVTIVCGSLLICACACMYMYMYVLRILFKHMSLPACFVCTYMYTTCSDCILEAHLCVPHVQLGHHYTQS